MYRFVVFSLFFAATVAPPPATSKVYRTDYVYNRKTDAFYKLHTETHNRFEAGRVCGLEGAALMLPSALQDVAQLHGMLKRFPDIGDHVWVAEDGQEHESAEEPAIIDLEPVTESYSPSWSRPCDVVSRRGDIESLPCYRPLPFVCKVTAGSAPYNRECDVYGNGYKVGQNVSSCYKIPKMSYTWEQAFAECRAEGAHLVILNSQTEHDTVQQLINTEPRVQGSRSWWFLFAGYRAEVRTDGAPRVFKTIFNETLVEAGYSTWTENEPNNVANDENCGTIFKNDGKLNDVNCLHLHGFICEKEMSPK